jgi:hypothetical protein
MGEKLGKGDVFLSGINCSNRVARTWEMLKVVVIEDLTEPMKMMKNCGIWFIHIDVSVSELWLRNCIEIKRQWKSLNFSTAIGLSTMAMLQLTKCRLSSGFGSQNRLLRTHPVPNDFGCSQK